MAESIRTVTKPIIGVVGTFVPPPYNTLPIFAHFNRCRYMYDRFNILNQEYPYAQRIGSLPNEFVPRPYDPKVTLESATEAAIKSLLDKHEKIGICWSGGVDSTYILSAFIAYGVDRSRFGVICTDTSVLEYTYGYEWLDDNGYDIALGDDSVPQTILEHPEYDVVVTGLGGNSIFPNNYTSYMPPYSQDDWKDGVRKQIATLRGEEVSLKVADKTIDLWQKYIDALQFPHSRWCELNSALRFGIYMPACLHSLAYRAKNELSERDAQTVIDKQCHFYLHHDFQQYGWQNIGYNPNRGRMEHPREYAPDRKALIYSVFKDQRYVDEAVEVNSFLLGDQRRGWEQHPKRNVYLIHSLTDYERVDDPSLF